MVKKFKGDLVLTKDTTFTEDIIVEGNIISKGGRWNINARNINARNINARDINARNINARDITAWNIDARGINAWNIDAWNIICESRKKKSKKAKTITRIFITKKSALERKEW